MQRKRYSWHLCVHYHGYLAPLQQNGLVHDLTPQIQEQTPPLSTALQPLSCCSFFFFSPENLNAGNSGAPNTNSPKVFNSFLCLHSLSVNVVFGRPSPWFSSNFSSKLSSIPYLQILPTAFYLRTQYYT